MSFSSPSRRALVATAVALAACLRPAKSRPADPVYAAIAGAKRADLALVAALDGLDEDDGPAMRRADALADASGDAIAALGETRPTTLAGLFALIRHYAEDAETTDPHSVGAHSLGRLAAVLPTDGVLS